MQDLTLDNLLLPEERGAAAAAAPLSPSRRGSGQTLTVPVSFNLDHIFV